MHGSLKVDNDDHDIHNRANWRCLFWGREEGSTPGQPWPGHPCKTYVSSPAIIFRGILVFFQVSRPGPGIN